MLIIPPIKRTHRARPVADAPPTPPPPPTPAVVVDAFRDDEGFVCTLVFDQPVAISGPFDFGDGAVQFNDQNPNGVSVGEDGVSLVFSSGSPVPAGAAWNVNAQPAWLVTVVATQGGNFP